MTTEIQHPFDQGLLCAFILSASGDIFSIKDAPVPILRDILLPRFQKLISIHHMFSEVHREAQEMLQALEQETQFDKMQRWWALYLLSEQKARPPIYFTRAEAQLAQRNYLLCQAS